MTAQDGFITPTGSYKLLDGQHHITTVLANPELFGFSGKEELEAIFEKHEEQVNTEGKARDEILIAVIKRGWLRVNYLPRNDKFIINVWAITPKVKNCLRSFAESASSGNIFGNKLSYSDVFIQAFSSNSGYMTSISKLRSGYLSNKKLKMVKLTMRNVLL